MTVFRFVFKRFFRRPSDIMLLLGLPLGVLFVPAGEWSLLPAGFQLYGIILMFIASRLASILFEDRVNGSLLRIAVAPISHFQYLLQNLLAYALIMTGMNLFFVVAAVLVHGMTIDQFGWLFSGYSIFAMVSIAFALAWYSLFRNRETALSIVTAVIILMAMLGGLMWPVQAMPPTFQRLAMLLPTYWLADWLNLVYGGAPGQEFILPAGMLLLFSLGLILVGSRTRVN